MANICFVIQHERSHPSTINVPSGTLTIVAHLIRHWPTEDKLTLLFNSDYGNIDEVRKLASETEVTLRELPLRTYQGNVARISYQSRNPASTWIQQTFAWLAMPFSNFTALTAIRRILREEKIEILYSHSGGYPRADVNLLATIAGRLERLQKNHLVIHNVPDPVLRRRLPFSFIQDRIIGTMASGVYSVSESCARSIKSIRYLRRPVGYVYNGIPTHRAPTPDTQIPTWARNGKHTLMFLGSLQRRKGLHILLQALPQVRFSYQLVVYGTGKSDYIASLNAMINQYELTEHVNFQGYDPNAAKYLKWATLLVLPSIAYESFGMVILEAMSHSKAVLCSDYGGMKEVVVDTETGIVVPAGDPTALAVAINQMLSDPARITAMGQAGRRRLERLFTIDQAIAKYRSL